MTLATSEEQAQALLDAVRRMPPRQLMRLAGMWAGVSSGELDPFRQRRRNAARLALRYLARRENASEPRARSVAAAMAVAEALTADGSQAMAHLRGPAADAAFAVADALDALAYADRLAPVAYDELLRPWKDLMRELGAADLVS